MKLAQELKEMLSESNYNEYVEVTDVKGNRVTKMETKDFFAMMKKTYEGSRLQFLANAIKMFNELYKGKQTAKHVVEVKGKKLGEP